MSPNVDPAKLAAENSALSALSSKIARLKNLRKASNSTALDLLVSVSGLLKAEDHLRLGPFLWGRYLEMPNTNVVPPVSSCLPFR